MTFLLTGQQTNGWGKKKTLEKKKSFLATKRGIPQENERALDLQCSHKQKLSADYKEGKRRRYSVELEASGRGENEETSQVRHGGEVSCEGSQSALAGIGTGKFPAW